MWQCRCPLCWSLGAGARAALRAWQSVWRRALSRRGRRRAVGVSSQQSSYLPTRVTDLSKGADADRPTQTRNRSLLPAPTFFILFHPPPHISRISHPFTNTQSAPPLLLPSARLECTVSPASRLCAENVRTFGGGGCLVGECGAVPVRSGVNYSYSYSSIGTP